MLKYIILSLLFVTLALPLKSQDKEPKTWKFKWGSDTTSRVLNIDSFPQSRFITGFQWSGTAE